MGSPTLFESEAAGYEAVRKSMSFGGENQLAFARGALEALVDFVGPLRVICALSDVAETKHDHILADWQDAERAKKWKYWARKLERFAIDEKNPND